MPPGLRWVGFIFAWTVVILVAIITIYGLWALLGVIVHLGRWAWA